MWNISLSELNALFFVTGCDHMTVSAAATTLMAFVAMAMLLAE